MRIWTSYFANPALKARDDLLKVGIVVYWPRWPLPYDAVPLRLPAPTGPLFRVRDPTEFQRLYFAKLDAIGLDVIRTTLEGLSKQRHGRDIVLLCFERDVHECHRGDFADWWLEQTGERILELPIGEGPKSQIQQLPLMGAKESV